MKLPAAQAWNGTHASEAALVMIADAQTHLVPDDVLAHTETCAECNDGIAEAAALSLRTEDTLGASVRDVRAAMPWRAILAAAAVALVGGLPSLASMAEAPGELGSTALSLLRLAPRVARHVAHLLEASSGSPWLTFAPAALLVLAGFALTRALPTPVSPGGPR